MLAAMLLSGCKKTKKNETKEASKNETPAKTEVVIKPEINLSASETMPGEAVTLSAKIDLEGEYEYCWQFKNERLYYPQNAKFDDLPIEILLVPVRIEKSRFESEILSKLPYEDKSGKRECSAGEYVMRVEIINFEPALLYIKNDNYSYELKK